MTSGQRHNKKDLDLSISTWYDLSEMEISRERHGQTLGFRTGAATDRTSSACLRVLADDMLY